MRFSETRKPAAQHRPFGGRGGLLTETKIEMDQMWLTALRNKNRPLSNKQLRSRAASKRAGKARAAQRN